MRSFFIIAAILGSLTAGVVACSSSSTPESGASDQPSATQWCGGNGSGVSGFRTSYHCDAEYVLCDGKTTLRVDCPLDGDGGMSLPCKCYTNGADGPTFDRGDTCDEIAKGHYEVGDTRFQAACGWGAYDLKKRVSAPK